MESILGELVFDDRTGEITLNRDRFVLIRPETLAALARAAGGEADRIFFKAGQEGGRIAAGKLWAEHGKDPEAVVRSLLDMGGAIGWARMKLTVWEGQDRGFRVEARSRTLDWPGGAGWELLGGILSGLGQVVFQGRVSVSRKPLGGRAEPVPGVRYAVRGKTTQPRRL